MAQYNKISQQYRAQDTTNFEVMMVSDSSGNIIDDFGGVGITTTAPVNSDIISRIQLANQTFSGYSYINKFGYRDVPAHESNYYSLTSQGDYNFPSSADIASVSSSSGSDNGGTILISGLDENYVEVEETITIGQSGTQQFLRVHRARMVTTNHSSGFNQGNITVEVDGETVAYIPDGYGQTLQCVYTVPANKSAYIFQIDVGVDEKEKPVHARIVSRDSSIANSAWNTKAFIVMESNYISHNQTIPIKVSEKNDILLEANSSDGSIEVSGGFDLVVVSN